MIRTYFSLVVLISFILELKNAPEVEQFSVTNNCNSFHFELLKIEIIVQNEISTSNFACDLCNKGSSLQKRLLSYASY